MLRNFSLGQRFALLLITVFVGGSLLSVFALSEAMRSKAEDEIAQRAEILVQTMNSVRSYTSAHIQPLLAAQLEQQDEFIPETVPAFSARMVFERFRARPEYEYFFYKEAALNPTNPVHMADPFEAELLERFRNDGDLTTLTGYRVKDSQRLFYISRPLAINDVSCLRCHSSPEIAPRSQIASYGSDGGFGWTFKEVVAAQTIYVPAEEVFASGRNYLMLVMAIFLVIFTLAILLINRLLKRAVIVPFNQLTETARDVGRGQLTPERLARFDSAEMTKVASRSDEAGELARSFQAMAHEVAAREDNLSRAVAERTAQLALTTEEAKKARGEAEEASNAKSQFLANMSHELRTPLNAIIGYGEMLREDAEDTGHGDYLPDLDKIVGAGRHLLALVNDILDLSRIEAGKVELYLESFDLPAEVAQVVATVQPLIQTNRNHLVVECPDDFGTVVCDLTKMRQVLFNLLSNAAKFTTDGEIRLKVESLPGSSPESFRVSVSDTGIGMNEAQLDRLFQTFSQADASTTRKYGGSGLGLAISRHFCRMMNGEISVSSTEGEGSEFVVTLPRQVPDPAPSEPDAGQAGMPLQRDDVTAEARTVLAIDDDPAVQELLARALSKQGYRVLGATSGQQGLDMARQSRPDVITLDVMMPGMDGWSVLAALKADPDLADIPVVMLTITSDRNMGYALGASHFLMKPIDRSELNRVIARYLGTSSNGSVLVVEDDPDTRELLRRILEGSDIRVGLAEHGVAGLEWLERHGPPDLILLDLMMPEMDGFEFIEALKTRPAFAQVPVVVVSAKHLDERDRARLQGSVVRILEKSGLRNDDLIALLKRYIGAHGSNDVACD